MNIAFCPILTALNDRGEITTEHKRIYRILDEYKPK